MQIILFTLVAVALYFVSDWVLQRIEGALGRRLEHRTLLFFAILLSSALVSFHFIEKLAGTP